MGEELREDEYEGEYCECKNEDDEMNVDEWEKFWETEEGQDPTFLTCSQGDWKKIQEEKVRKPIKVKPNMMKMLRREEWKKEQRQEDLEDKNKVWRTHEVLEENIQNQEEPMVIIGCDVEALYPSLEVEEIGNIIVEEVMRSSISWENLDYMEGVRLIALNRSAKWCREHELRRVLPVRRYRTGSRPGVRGRGPMGEERGDTEQ